MALNKEQKYFLNTGKRFTLFFGIIYSLFYIIARMFTSRIDEYVAIMILVFGVLWSLTIISVWIFKDDKTIVSEVKGR